VNHQALSHLVFTPSGFAARTISWASAPRIRRIQTDWREWLPSRTTPAKGEASVYLARRNRCWHYTLKNKEIDGIDSKPNSRAGKFDQGWKLQSENFFGMKCREPEAGSD
jgi:hypothetical protein